MIPFGTREKSMKEDGTVWLPWEADSESESEGSGQEVHKVSWSSMKGKEREGTGRGKNWAVMYSQWKPFLLECSGDGMTLWEALNWGKRAFIHQTLTSDWMQSYLRRECLFRQGTLQLRQSLKETDNWGLSRLAHSTASSWGIRPSVLKGNLDSVSWKGN